jgi:hypothetical protein
MSDFWSAMRESVTYQAILEEGRREGAVTAARKFLLLLGHQYLGEPSKAMRRTVEAITDLTCLERMCVRLAEAESWQDLLQEPAAPQPPRRSRRRTNGDT